MKSRRYFLKWGLPVFLILPWVRTGKLWAKLAKSCPQGSPTSERVKNRLINDGHRKRLHYVDHWEEGKEHEKFTQGANCANCAFYKPDRKEPTYGRCIRAAMKYVPSCGWCEQYEKVKETKKS